MKKSIVVILLLFISVVPSSAEFRVVENISYSIYGDYSHGEVDVIQMGLDYWEENSVKYLGVQVRYHATSDTPDLIIRVDDDSVKEICDESKSPKTTTRGCALKNAIHVTDKRAFVVLQENLLPYSLYHLVKHELGHNFSLNHGDAPKFVMKAVVEKEDYGKIKKQYFTELRKK